MKFPVYDAVAEIRGDGSLKVTMTYPDAARRKLLEETDYKLSTANIVEFWMQSLFDLSQHGYAILATHTVPLKPASGRMLYVVDDTILTHKRDDIARIHPGHFSFPSGFPSEAAHHTDIPLLQKKELAEEMLLYDCEGNIYQFDDEVLDRFMLGTMDKLGISRPRRSAK